MFGFSKKNSSEHDTDGTDPSEEEWDDSGYKGYIPPEMRRRPIYNRMPKWAQALADGIERLFKGAHRGFRNAARHTPLWAGVCLALVLGFGIGAFVMRLRKEAGEVMLVINGQIITVRDYHRRMEITHGRESLQRLLENRLALQYARERNLLPSESEVKQRTSQLLAQPGVHDGLVRRHLSEGDVTDQVRIALAKDRILQNGVSISDAEVAAYYRRQSDPKNTSARFYLPESVSLQIIVTKTEPQIRAAWQELTAKGSFAQTVKRFSAHRLSASHEGNFGPLLRGRTPFHKVPGFETLVFGMKPGDLSPPTQFGATWWIARCVARTPAQTLPFDKVREMCRIGALEEKSHQMRGPQAGADFAEYRKQSPIHVFWERYARDLTGQPKQRVASGSP